MAATYNTPKGLDWDKLRADYRARCSPEELEALDAKPAPAPKAPAIINTPTGSRGTARTTPAKPKAAGDSPSRTSPETEAKVRELYRSGKHVLEIGETAKLHRTTVRRILVEANLWTGTGDQHRPGHAARMSKAAS